MTRLGPQPDYAAVAAADEARRRWARDFRMWMDAGGFTSAVVQKLCKVSAATVSKWRTGDAMPSEQHQHTLARAGFDPPAGVPA